MITIEDLEHIINTYQIYFPNEYPIICLPKSTFEDLTKTYPKVEHHRHLMQKLSFEDDVVYYISALKLHDIMMKNEMKEFWQIDKEAKNVT